MKNRGYTLVETLLAVSIFFILVAGPTGLFILSLKNQNRALGLRESVDNSSHALEYISRALRMARKDVEGTCITAGSNYENPGSVVSAIRFLNYQNFCQEFSLSGDRLQEKKSTDETSGNLPVSGTYFTPDDMEVTLAKFKLLGESQGDNIQPRVTMLFEITKRNIPSFPRVKVQTSISQRNLDMGY